MPAIPHRVVPRGAFGDDAFGRFSEKTARFFGTPHYIIGQTIIVCAWLVLNSVAWVHHWDGRPFILLNLAFSTQAAYAAPLILLAQTRQADRDKVSLDAADAHREEVTRRMQASEDALRHATDELRDLLLANTELTRRDTELTQQVASLAQA